MSGVPEAPPPTFGEPGTARRLGLRLIGVRRLHGAAGVRADEHVIGMYLSRVQDQLALIVEGEHLTPVAPGCDPPVVSVDFGRLIPFDGDAELMVVAELLGERRRAHDKHGKTSMEQAEVTEHYRASIVSEEAGEVARVLNDLRHAIGQIQQNYPSGAPGSADEYHREQEMAHALRHAKGKLRTELLQLGAMALAWVCNLDGHVLEPGA